MRQIVYDMRPAFGIGRDLRAVSGKTDVAKNFIPGNQTFYRFARGVSRKPVDIDSRSVFQFINDFHKLVSVKRVIEVGHVKEVILLHIGNVNAFAVFGKSRRGVMRVERGQIFGSKINIVGKFYVYIRVFFDSGCEIEFRSEIGRGVIAENFVTVKAVAAFGGRQALLNLRNVSRSFRVARKETYGALRVGFPLCIKSNVFFDLVHVEIPFGFVSIFGKPTGNLPVIVVFSVYVNFGFLDRRTLFHGHRQNSGSIEFRTQIESHRNFGIRGFRFARRSAFNGRFVRTGRIHRSLDASCGKNRKTCEK